MRLLWLTEHYPPSRGGMAESCDRIVRGLREAGVEIDVAHLTRRERPWQIGGERGGRLLTVPLEDNPEHALRRLWTATRANWLLSPSFPRASTACSARVANASR